MLRACRKTTLHMRELRSPYFEEAFFILRRDLPASPAADSLAAEAERIAAECTDPAGTVARRRRSAVLKKTLFFLLGALAGTAVSSVIINCIGSA